jgi:Domain of unknown function (DUF4349)
MQSTFKIRFLKLCKYFGGIFIFLFLFRLLYGYIATDSNVNSDFGGDFFSSIDNLRKNYASEKPSKYSFSKNETQPQQAAPSMNTSQKFEKTATVRSKSSEFEPDETTIRNKTKGFAAIVQYEQKLGQKGNRELHLMIGVDPIKFDSFYLEMQKIGVIKATQITKVDKTNEYRQLNAKKASLEKTLLSLNELKSRGGEIVDYIALHDKILEIETQMQGLGVELGNFDTENEFCTVKLSMYEGATQKSISFIHRVKVALEWTIQYFAISVLALLGLSILILVMIMIVDKLKIFEKLP